MRRSEAIISCTEEPDQTDDDEIKGNDIVQQPGHDQDQDSCNQRYQRANTQSHVHAGFLFWINEGLGFGVFAAIGAALAGWRDTHNLGFKLRIFRADANIGLPEINLSRGLVPGCLHGARAGVPQRFHSAWLHGRDTPPQCFGLHLMEKIERIAQPWHQPGR